MWNAIFLLSHAIPSLIFVPEVTPWTLSWPPPRPPQSANCLSFLPKAPCAYLCGSICGSFIIIRNIFLFPVVYCTPTVEGHINFDSPSAWESSQFLAHTICLKIIQASSLFLSSGAIHLKPGLWKQLAGGDVSGNPCRKRGPRLGARVLDTMSIRPRHT